MLTRPLLPLLFHAIPTGHHWHSCRGKPCPRDITCSMHHTRSLSDSQHLSSAAHMGHSLSAFSASYSSGSSGRVTQARNIYQPPTRLSAKRAPQHASHSLIRAARIFGAPSLSAAPQPAARWLVGNTSAGPGRTWAVRGRFICRTRFPKGSRHTVDVTLR
jgi:hypothetical protein